MYSQYLKEPQAVHEFRHQLWVFEPQHLRHVAQEEAQLFGKERAAQGLSAPVAEHVQHVGHEVALQRGGAEGACHNNAGIVRNTAQ